MEHTTPDFAAHVYSGVKSGEARPFSTPETLREFVVTCMTETKPLILARLVKAIMAQGRGGEGGGGESRKILIFTGTVKNTHRLCRLLQILQVVQGDGGKKKNTKEGEEVAKKKAQKNKKKEKKEKNATILL